MRKFGLTLVLIALAGAIAAPVFAADKVAIAIMPFKEGQLADSWYGWELAEGITNLVTDELVKRNKVIVVERTRIDELMQEQNLGADGFVEEATASQIGKLSGARLMLMGTITMFDLKQTAGIGIGPFRIGGSQAKVELTARIVDTETGQVLGSIKGEGSKTGASFSVDNFKGVSLDGEEFQNSSLGQAANIAIKQLVDNMIGVVEKADLKVTQAAAAAASSGTVLMVLGPDQVIISLGASSGMKVNTMVNIYHLMTVPGLKDPMRVPVATAKVTSVDKDASFAQIISKTQDVQQGDVVAPQ